MSEVTLIAGRPFNVADIRKRIDTWRKATWDDELRELMVLCGALIDAYRSERRVIAREPVGFDGNGSEVCEYP